MTKDLYAQKRRGRGRPHLTGAFKRCEMVTFRATPGELQAINEMAAEYGVARSEFITMACFTMGGRSPLRATKILAERMYKDRPKRRKSTAKKPAPDAPKRPRGRPRTRPVNSKPKRPRGRPRKYPLTTD